MSYIVLVNEKYESEQDLYNLLQYVFRLDKTATDKMRANTITTTLTGWGPCIVPDCYYNDPDMVFRVLSFVNQQRHKSINRYALHRIISFSPSDCIAPQDLLPLAESLIAFYVSKGFIAAYGIHADAVCPNIHIVINPVNYFTRNLFHMKWSFELEALNQMANSWENQHKTALQNDQGKRQLRQAELYGDDMMKYGSIPISTKMQMKQSKNRIDHKYRQE